MSSSRPLPSRRYTRTPVPVSCRLSKVKPFGMPTLKPLESSYRFQPSGSDVSAPPVAVGAGAGALVAGAEVAPCDGGADWPPPVGALDCAGAPLDATGPGLASCFLSEPGSRRATNATSATMKSRASAPTTSGARRRPDSSGYVCPTGTGRALPRIGAGLTGAVAGPAGCTRVADAPAGCTAVGAAVSDRSSTLVGDSPAQGSVGWPSLLPAAGTTAVFPAGSA